jgi:hypothetical protein
LIWFADRYRFTVSKGRYPLKLPLAQFISETAYGQKLTSPKDRLTFALGYKAVLLSELM